MARVARVGSNAMTRGRDMAFLLRDFTMQARPVHFLNMGSRQSMYDDEAPLPGPLPILLRRLRKTRRGRNAPSLMPNHAVRQLIAKRAAIAGHPSVDFKFEI